MVKLSVDEIITIHNRIVDRFKITSGIINKGILEAIIERPELKLENQAYLYNNVYSKAAVILEGMIRWHPFADGNKRTALATAIYYLTLEGYATALPLSAVRYTVNIAKNDNIDSVSTQQLINEISNWFREHSDRKPLVLFGKLVVHVIIPYRFLMILTKLGFENFVYRKVQNWMAFDIYPEYQKEVNQIVAFIQDTLTSSLKVVFPDKVK